MDIALSESHKDSEQVLACEFGFNKGGTCPPPGLKDFDRETGKGKKGEEEEMY